MTGRLLLSGVILIPALAGCPSAQPPAPPVSVTVIAEYGNGNDQPVSVPCSWVNDNPYGPYLPRDGAIPVTYESWLNASEQCATP